VVEEIAGIDGAAVELMEERRLRQIFEEERAEQEQKRARAEARAAARSLQPVRRSPRLANKAKAPLAGEALRRSARLAAKARCDYKV
jgi:hypothetical protein